MNPLKNESNYNSFHINDIQTTKVLIKCIATLRCIIFVKHKNIGEYTNLSKHIHFVKDQLMILILKHKEYYGTLIFLFNLIFIVKFKDMISN